jgi:hypothetical protein
MGKDGDSFAKLIAIASLLVSIVGLGSIIIGIESFKQSERAALADASQRIITDSANVDKLFIQYPEMRPFFREKKPIRRGDEGYDRAAAIAELRVNAYDAVLTFPSIFKADNWSNVARSAFRDSPIMCEFISMYKDNYSKTTLQIADEVCQR